MTGAGSRKNPVPIIGRRAFTDGVTRDVFLDAVGQYVLGDDGRQVRGVWLLADQEDVADVPAIVSLVPPKSED